MSRRIKFDGFQFAAKIAMACALFLVAACFVPSLVGAQTNLLLNADLTAGTGDAPQNWQHDPYTGQPGDVEFEWVNYTDPASLEVFNYQPRDSRWTQKLHLKPGWYHFTASVRTENVGEVDTGANISIMESWILSRHVHGTSYWEPVGFYLQVPKETDVTLACRLGFYSSQNTGRAYFRDLSVVKVAAPAADDPSFKLETWAKPAAK
jgi:dolichyl-phosphate-mannose-protein mannosyltransferase